MWSCWRPSAKGPGFSSQATDGGAGVNSCVIGIDIGGTNFRIGAVSEDGALALFRKLPVEQVFRSKNPLEDLTACLKEYRRTLQDQGGAAEAVAIGFPATLDRERRVVLQAPNVPFMENLPVVEALAGELGIPVFIERDVTMALLYDQAKYRLPGEGIICGFYFGTGVGNAICVDGRPLVGRGGAAGELGHIPVDGSGLPCGCGNTGCIENLAGGKYLARLQRERYPETSIARLFAEHGTGPELVRFVDRMAIAAATEINILDPDCVLIGGGVPAMEGFPRELLLERIRLRARKPYPAADLPVIFTGDEDEKCVVGGARYAWGLKQYILKNAVTPGPQSYSMPH